MLRQQNQKRTQSRSSKIPSRTRERYWVGTGAVVAGVDEVGRGAWAGPLVAAAVMLPADRRISGLRDSKLLAAPVREQLASRIWSFALSVSMGTVSVEELNRIGLPTALHEAGRRAVVGLKTRPGRILLDGHFDYFGGEWDCETIIRGDVSERSIAAASIVAKVHRDSLMRELDATHPGYGFADHKGYGTAAHRKALRKQGPSAAHRSQWQPILELTQRQLPV